MFRVRRTAPLSRVEYVGEKERERIVERRRKKQQQMDIFTCDKIFFSIFIITNKKKRKFSYVFSLNFTAVDNLYVAKFDYRVKCLKKLNLFFFEKKEKEKY